MTENFEANLPEAIEMVIGRFISNFSLLEEWIKEIILDAADINLRAGDIILSEIPFRGLLNACGAIIHEYSDNLELCNEADKLMVKIDHMNDFRNQIVHSVLFGDIDRTQGFRIKTKAHRKKGAQITSQELKREDLLEKCVELAQLINEVKQIGDKIYTEQSVALDSGQKSARTE